MIGFDRAVLEQLLAAIPPADRSPLLASSQAQDRFLEWCAESAGAHRVLEEVLADARVFQYRGHPNEFIVAVDRPMAERLIRSLATAYENETLERLLNAG